MNDVIDLKKLIEYDRKYNHVSTLSPSPKKNGEQDYSERMKASSVREDAVHLNDQFANAGQQVSDQSSKTLERVNLNKKIVVHKFVHQKSG